MNDVTPQISIIVPALNEEKLIAGTLALFPREERIRHGIELIVSDGGSSDATVTIASEHADVVVAHTEKRRQTIAEGRNMGAGRARGELLVFINADTVPADPAKFLAGLTELVGQMRNGSRIVAIACPVEIAEAERKRSDTLFHLFFNNYVRALNGVGLGMGRGECQVIRADAFRAAGGYNSAMVAGEDFDLYKRLRAKGKIGHRSDLLVYESPRRFRRYGYIRVLGQWTMNAISVLMRGRAVSSEWEQIR